MAPEQCISDGLLASLGAETPDAVWAEVDGHVAECSECRRLVAAYARLHRSDEGSACGARLSVATVDRLIARAATFALVGRQLSGKWTLDAVIGVGGMGQVYSATHRNGSRVAIKVLHGALVGNARLVARFRREGYLANAVGHPGVVTVLDDGVTDEGHPFLVMELLHGQTLRKRLTEGGPLCVGEACALTERLLDILVVAHSRGILHRDIKPENVFIETDGSVRLLDFGIARIRELAASAGEGHTEPGTLFGTPAFMPPEQARGQVTLIDERSDLWAIGATLFSALTGRGVRDLERQSSHGDARNPNEELFVAMTEPVERVRALVPGIPERMGAFIDRALCFEQEGRWPSAADMRAALRGLSAPSSRAAARTWPVALAALGLILVAVGWALHSSPRGALTDAGEPAAREPASQGRFASELARAPAQDLEPGGTPSAPSGDERPAARRSKTVGHWPKATKTSAEPAPARAVSAASSSAQPAPMPMLDRRH